MVSIVKGTLLAGAISLALGGIASAAGTLTDAEFKCQKSTSKAGAKFVDSKMKCVMKCQQNAAKGINAIADCYPPYNGMALSCIADPLRGAEAKFVYAIRKACDPTFKPGADCPECYHGGNCAIEAVDRMQNFESSVDLYFPPRVFCVPAPTKEELTCEMASAKTIAKHIGAVEKCYARCNANVRKGVVSQASCEPPVEGPVLDPPTADCLFAAFDKWGLVANKKCFNIGTIALPDCDGNTDNYPDGYSLASLAEFVFSSYVPSTFCQSASGAFLD